ncbi:unnamed protein product [Rhizoctonia solani]|uniref:CxC1-like cysteine cluster associated with KDZ transposases domain-containing protein n=1 Tax=Rhizoctonia solani TaxID=456999 RepID=A0A8H3B5I7_9AGAM|nr:unnamed protein product [Rhizoctonia solani]
MTVAKLAELSERNKAREKAEMEEKLTNAQREELNNVQQQVAGGGIFEDWEPLYDRTMNDDLECNSNSSDSDDEWEDDDEVAVVDELGLRGTGGAEWEDRLRSHQDAWGDQIPTLINAYLAFLDANTHPDSEPAGPEISTGQFKIRCISLWREETKSFPLHNGNSSVAVNVTLIQNGFIAPSPTRPTVAISVKLLELLATVQKRCPSISVQGMARSFCDLRNVPFKNYFRTQLSTALDVYYVLQRECQQRLHKILGLDSLEAKLKARCPPCTNKVTRK